MNNIKHYRLKAGLSVAELSKRTKIPYTYINKCERGNRKPKYEALVKIACALDIPVDFLIYDYSFLEDLRNQGINTKGKALNYFRKSKKISIAELSTLTGITFSQLHQYEKETRNPKIEILLVIVNVLSIPLEYIFWLDEDLRHLYIENKRCIYE